MPLIIPNSLRLGPTGSSSAPASLSAFLTSIGKASWYANWLASLGLDSLSTGLGGAVASGGVVGRWSPLEQVGFNYNFIQATSANRPTYDATICSDGVPAIYGNGSSWSLSLDSTTALNRDFTILISAETLNASNSYLFSKGGDQWSYYTNSIGNGIPYYASTTLIADQQIKALSDGLSTPGTHRIRKFAMSSGTSTGHYGNALRLLMHNAAYFAFHRIRGLALVPKLTANECSQALQYLP